MPDDKPVVSERDREAAVAAVVDMQAMDAADEEEVVSCLFSSFARAREEGRREERERIMNAIRAVALKLPDSVQGAIAGMIAGIEAGAAVLAARRKVPR